MIRSTLVTVSRAIHRVFYRPPAVAEFFTCWGGLGYVLVAMASDDDALIKSIQYLSRTGFSVDFWYAVAFFSMMIQLMGLLCGYRWIRWTGAVLVAAWWATLAKALFDMSGITPFVPIYLALAGVNCYSFMHLLWED